MSATATCRITVSCSLCETCLPDGGAMPRIPCAQCGGIVRNFDAQLEIEGGKSRMGVSLKAKHQGANGKHKHHFESKKAWELNRDLGVDVNVQRSINRDADRYTESVVTELGTIIREVDEPLSMHRARGDYAKRKK